MNSPERKHLDALLEAWLADRESALAIWDQLPREDQEELLLTLLAAHPDAPSAVAGPQPDEPVSAADPGESPTSPVDETNVIPKVVEDLRGLSVAQRDDRLAPPSNEVFPTAMADYRARWRRRWKISVVVAAWVVTTVFAFTTDTSTFGPSEWFVALFATIVLGGALVGTLINFAVAAIPLTRR